jgi:hypothetical protein
MTAVAPERPFADRLVGQGLGTRPIVVLTVLAALVVGASAVLGPVVPVALSLGALLAVSAWHRPVVAAATVVAVCPAISGIARGLGLGSLKASELLLVLCVAVVVLRRPVRGQQLRVADVGLIAFAVLGATFGAIHTLTGSSTVASFLRVGLQPALLFLTYWTASRSMRDRGDLSLVLRWLLVVSPVPALLAVAQGFNVPGVRALLIRITGGPSLALPSDPGIARVTGPFPIWHSLTAYLLIPFVVGVVLVLRGDREVLSRPVLLGVLAVDGAALALAVTATVIVWAVVGVLFAAHRQGRLRQAMVLLVATTGVAGLLFSGPIAARFAEQQVNTTVSQNATGPRFVPQTIAYRFTVWNRDYVPLLERAVPYGIDNELPDSIVFKHAENQYITTALRGGVLLLIGMVSAFVLLGADLHRLGRRDDLVGAVAGALLGILLFLPVTAMIWPYVTNAGFPQAFLSLTGAVAGAAAARGRRRTDVEKENPPSRGRT